RVDRRVRLNEVLVCFDAEIGAAFGGNDAHRHRLADAERIADRQHDVTQAQTAGVAELDGGQVADVALQLDYRQIALRVRAHDGRGVVLAVGGGDFDF